MSTLYKTFAFDPVVYVQKLLLAVATKYKSKVVPLKNIQFPAFFGRTPQTSGDQEEKNEKQEKNKEKASLEHDIGDALIKSDFSIVVPTPSKQKRFHSRVTFKNHTVRARAVLARARAGSFDVESLQKKYESYVAPRLGIKEQTFFAKRLAFLTRAGVPVLESLHMLRSQTKKRSHIRILDQIIRDTAHGQSLSKSFGKFPHVFGDFAINIIKVGETSGILGDNLDYLAEELKKKHTLKRKVMGALTYPILVTVATFGITGFLMIYLFPKILPIFSSLHMQLPLSTKIVIAVSTFLRVDGGWALLVFLLCIAGYLFALKKSIAFRRQVHIFILCVPLFGTMAKNYNLANATRTLGLMLKSGVVLSDALPLTADTTANLSYKEAYGELTQAIRRGERLATYLTHRSDLFPDVLSQMIAVGEKTGNLSTTLVYLSEMYEGEVDDFSKDISSLIEPALMILMGVLVGFIAVSIITPIYSITQNLHA